MSRIVFTYIIPFLRPAAIYAAWVWYRTRYADRHGGEVYVYRRAGLPCYLCGDEVQVTDMQARNLFWCPTCQRT